MRAEDVVLSKAGQEVVRQNKDAYADSTVFAHSNSKGIAAPESESIREVDVHKRIILKCYVRYIPAIVNTRVKYCIMGALNCIKLNQIKDTWGLFRGTRYRDNTCCYHKIIANKCSCQFTPGACVENINTQISMVIRTSLYKACDFCISLAPLSSISSLAEAPLDCKVYFAFNTGWGRSKRFDHN